MYRKISPSAVIVPSLFFTTFDIIHPSLISSSVIFHTILLITFQPLYIELGSFLLPFCISFFITKKTLLTFAFVFFVFLSFLVYHNLSIVTPFLVSNLVEHKQVLPRNRAELARYDTELRLSTRYSSLLRRLMLFYIGFPTSVHSA